MKRKRLKWIRLTGEFQLARLPDNVVIAASPVGVLPLRREVTR